MEPESRRPPDYPESQAILERSIEEGLRYVLGESGLQMVLRLYPMARISTDPARFHEAMQDIFMEDGAAIIEREIARRLLQGAAEERAGGRARRSWFRAPAHRDGPAGVVSERQKKLLRRFVALASLPEGHGAEGPAIETSSMEMTTLRFAEAFKKGS